MALAMEQADEERNMQRIYEIQAKFGSGSEQLVRDALLWCSCSADLSRQAVPGRKLLLESILKKSTRHGPAARHFFLFNDMLVYAQKGITGRLSSQVRAICDRLYVLQEYHDVFFLHSCVLASMLTCFPIACA